MTDPTAPYAARAPHPALRGLVSFVGYRHVEDRPGLHRGLPSTALTGILAFDEPIDVSWQDDSGRGRHWAMVSGLHAAPALIRYDRVQHGIQLAFTPRGARELLGVPAGALARELVPIQDVWGGFVDEVYDGVAGASTWTRRFDLLEQHLVSRLGVHDQPGIRHELQLAWRRVRTSRGAVHVGDLAAEVGWSRRHLTERFTDEFGIGPKQAARIERFQRACELLASCPSIAAVAVDCGYADQAHLTREFRELAGCTPTQWRREALPFVQDSLAAD